MQRSWLLVFGAVAATAIVAAACGGDDGMDMGGMGMGSAASDARGDDSPTNDLVVSLRNWTVEPSGTVLQAGKVKFTAVHESEMHMGGHGGDGGLVHQLVVARLDEGANAGTGKIGSPLVNLYDLKPGDRQSAEAELAPGKYELSCLVVENINGKTVNHYAKGMFTTVTVQ